MDPSGKGIKRKQSTLKGELHCQVLEVSREAWSCVIW